LTPRDKFVLELPDYVRQDMVQHIGEELTARLLTEDFLREIDWRLFQEKSNGGANLDDIRMVK
jgi:hypothetical protein